ncbi:hypothetical protein HZS_1264 [Henneguya salminicola]|nr:hypothetical protein HZS_1264 [Henneguya salminicola]
MSLTGENRTAKQIRKDFIEFFEQSHHVYVPSSSTVPNDDPTLLFTNAGMNQFKNIFLGQINPYSSLGQLKRACNSQKCIRAGGKHNDLDDVGKDVYHHTFFEMLGNWSFNDYFKKEAISFAWILLTDVWKLPKDRFYVTYFRGNENVPEDIEAKNFWLECGLSEANILPFGMKENFWEMGEEGPCGPCSEIHYDRIGNRDAASLVNMDDPDVLEIWNLVFIQYNRENNGYLNLLRTQHVDTGMGFERIVSIIQNKQSNYDTDIFLPYFDKIRELTGSIPYSNLVGDCDPDKIHMSYRVVADHIRTLTIAMTDGCRPDCTGRGYVIRRILRRAIRFSHEKLNMKRGDLANLVDVAAEQLGDAFPDVCSNKSTIKSIINEEENQFLKTLSKGVIKLNKAIENSTNFCISGKVGWLLYETYGFPIDLTQIIAQEKGVCINMEEFELEKIRAQQKSRGESSFKTTKAMLTVQDIDIIKSMGIPFTDSEPKYSYIVTSDMNYVFPQIDSTIMAIKIHDDYANEASDCSDCLLILDQTNFYAEEGGQLADTGTLSTNKGDTIFVKDVQVYSGFVVHACSVQGTILIGDRVSCLVEPVRRKNLMMNHTVTHILNFAIRNLIKESEQRGSFVSTDKLRFDFLSDTPITPSQIILIEDQVNNIIKSNEMVFSEIIPLDQAMKIKGIRGVFGETYPDPARIVSIGIPILKVFKERDAGYKNSIELCGGLHVQRSSHIIDFVILYEEGIGKALRRFTCVTGTEAAKAKMLVKDWNQKISAFKNLQKELLQRFNTQECSKICITLSTAIKDIGNIPLPYKNRCEFREIMNALRSLLVETCRKEELRMSKELSIKFNKLTLQSGSQCFFVNHLTNVSSSKILDTVAKGLEVPIFLTCHDEQNQKILYYSAVPKNMINNNVSAKLWCVYISEKTNSRSGGKDTIAQGACSNSYDVVVIINHAEEYGKKMFPDFKIIKCF